MDLRQLQYVIAVADHGGFTRAASAMRVTQPSMSHGVRTLEAELGVELFARLGRSVQITPAGQLIVDAARRVVRDMAELIATAASSTALKVGHLDIVSLPTLAVDPLARLLGRFRMLYPGVTIRVHEPEEAAAIDRQVLSGRAELGLTDLTTGGVGLERVELFRQEIVAVSPPGTVLPDGPLNPAELAALALIATPPGTSTRRLLDRTLMRSGTIPNIVVEISQREAILPLVLAGAGTSLLPASSADDARARGAVVRAIRPPLTRRVGLLHRPGSLSAAAAAMIALATDVDPGRGRAAPRPSGGLRREVHAGTTPKH